MKFIGRVLAVGKEVLVAIYCIALSWLFTVAGWVAWRRLSDFLDVDER